MSDWLRGTIPIPRWLVYATLVYFVVRLVVVVAGMV